MGLIEKAAGGVRGEPGAIVEPGPGYGAAPEFDINFPVLKRHGFYSPEDRSSRLSLELRAIKRNLLRRIGFRNAGGERRLGRKSGRQRNLVLVTSTQPGEGKTFCSINLALSLALEESMEVLLVDADIPRPKIRAHFGLPEMPGLTDLLDDPALSPDQISARARQAPLSILSEGSQLARASDRLASAEGQRVFTDMSMRDPGRVVIFDAPPVLATTEAIMLARHVDEIVFVVQADSTPEPALSSALDELLEANPNVSLLLNRCLIGPGGSYYGSYGDYDRNDDSQRRDRAGEAGR